MTIVYNYCTCVSLIYIQATSVAEAKMKVPSNGMMKKEIPLQPTIHAQHPVYSVDYMFTVVYTVLAWQQPALHALM